MSSKNKFTKGYSKVGWEVKQILDEYVYEMCWCNTYTLILLTQDEILVFQESAYDVTRYSFEEYSRMFSPSMGYPQLPNSKIALG